MPVFNRYAVYDPGPAELASFGAEWLGWDVEAGQAVDISYPPEWTDTPRRYGFHATIKAPFRLADGTAADALEDAFVAMCGRLAPVMLPRLTLAEIDGFLALVAQPQPAALSNLELRVVEDLDRFRAPLTEADVARRRPERLTERQREHLTRSGYPFVGADFTWHMTLTGQLPADQLAAARMALAKALPPLPDPHPVSRLALMGEDAAGRFHLIRTAALAA